MGSSAVNKLFRVVAVVMFGLQLFSAGAEFADNNVADGTIALVLAVFWGGFLLIEWLALSSEVKWLRKFEKKSMGLLDDLMAAVEKHDAEMKAKPGRSARHDAAAKRGDAARAKLNKKAPAKKVSKK